MTFGGGTGLTSSDMDKVRAEADKSLPPNWRDWVHYMLAEIERLRYGKLDTLADLQAEIARLEAETPRWRDSHRVLTERVAQLEGVVGWARTLMNAKSGSGTDIAADMLRQALAALDYDPHRSPRHDR